MLNWTCHSSSGRYVDTRFEASWPTGDSGEAELLGESIGFNGQLSHGAICGVPAAVSWWTFQARRISIRPPQAQLLQQLLCDTMAAASAVVAVAREIVNGSSG